MSRLPLLAGVLALTAAVAGCAGSHGAAAPRSSTPTEQAIVRVQASSVGGEFAGCPKAVASQPYVINGGGRAPGIRVKGSCSTSVSVRSAGRFQAIVTFDESWPWTSFHYAGTPRRRLHHSWRFGVLANGRVVVVGNSGDFPPQSVI